MIQPTGTGASGDPTPDLSVVHDTDQEQTDAKATETKMDFFVDGLPTTWESLKSLYGFEMEAVDIIQNRVNVLLKPNSSFFAEQNLKRFIDVRRQLT